MKGKGRGRRNRQQIVTLSSNPPPSLCHLCAVVVTHHLMLVACHRHHSSLQSSPSPLPPRALLLLFLHCVLKSVYHLGQGSVRLPATTPSCDSSLIPSHRGKYFWKLRVGWLSLCSQVPLLHLGVPYTPMLAQISGRVFHVSTTSRTGLIKRLKKKLGPSNSQ